MDRGRLILIVDDQSEVRALLRDLFESAGYDVIEAADGPSGLTSINDADPDLVVLDHMMPELTGIDVLRTLRSSRPSLPVILLTAYGDDETTWQGWAAGASFFMDKPFDNDALLDWVARLLNEPLAKDDGQTYYLGSHHRLGDADPPLR